MRNRIRPGGPFLTRTLLDAQTVFALPAAEYQFGTHQLAIHQSQCFSFIWKAAAAAVAVASTASPPLVTNARAPQLFDFTLQADLFAPIPMAQGLVTPLVRGAQDDPTQIAARVFPAARAAPANPIAGFFVVPPQNEDRPTAVVWGPQRVGQTPPMFRLVQGAPQLLDQTQQGSIFGPAIGPSLPFRSLAASPQFADFTQQGVIFVPGQPATLITGTTVWPIPSVPPQPDLNVNASFVWTQSPLTVAGIAPPPIPSSEQPAGRRTRNIYRVTVDGNKFEFKSYFDAIDFLDKTKAAAGALARETVRKALDAKDVQPPKFERPKITISSRDLRGAVSETRKAIEAIYESATQDVEIAILIEIGRRKAEDEAIWLLW